VLRDSNNKESNAAGSIATFNVDHKSSKELRQYLTNIAEQCEHSASELPTIIVLDNLHHVNSLAEVFNGFLSIEHAHWLVDTSCFASSQTTFVLVSCVTLLSVYVR